MHIVFDTFSDRMASSGVGAPVAHTRGVRWHLPVRRNIYCLENHRP